MGKRQPCLGTHVEAGALYSSSLCPGRTRSRSLDNIGLIIYPSWQYCRNGTAAVRALSFGEGMSAPTADECRIFQYFISTFTIPDANQNPFFLQRPISQSELFSPHDILSLLCLDAFHCGRFSRKRSCPKTPDIYRQKGRYAG